MPEPAKRLTFNTATRGAGVAFHQKNTPPGRVSGITAPVFFYCSTVGSQSGDIQPVNFSRLNARCCALPCVHGVGRFRPQNSSCIDSPQKNAITRGCPTEKYGAVRDMPRGVSGHIRANCPVFNTVTSGPAIALRDCNDGQQKPSGTHMKT